MICRRIESNDILLELVAKTLAVGATEIQVEYEDCEEHVLAFQEGVGFGIARLDASSEEAQALREALYQIRRKQKSFNSARDREPRAREAAENEFYDILFLAVRSSELNKRGFIEDCLSKALTQVSQRLPFELDPRVDRDTKGRSGAPDIVETVFAKIAAAQAFVADVSIVSKERRKYPNPNVLIELGYAVHSLTRNRIVLVYNESFGQMVDLPFDISRNRILTYRLPKTTTYETQKEDATRKLVQCITCFQSRFNASRASREHFAGADMLWKQLIRCTSVPS